MEWISTINPSSLEWADAPFSQEQFNLNEIPANILKQREQTANDEEIRRIREQADRWRQFITKENYVLETPAGKKISVNVAQNRGAKASQAIKQEQQSPQPPQPPTPVLSTPPPPLFQGTPSYGYLAQEQAEAVPGTYSGLFGPPPGYVGTTSPMDAEAERLIGQNIPYASVYTGQKPITPQELYDQRMRMIQEYNIPYNERMQRAYNQDKRSTMRRIFDRILTQDPFYDEKVAGQIANYDQQMALQVLNLGQQALLQKAQDDAQLRLNNAKILEQKLNENPLLRQNSQFMEDIGITIGIPKEDVPAWLEKQKDQSGRYTFITDPIQAQKDAVKRQAEILAETLGIDMQKAIIAVHDPELKRGILGSAEKNAEIDLANAYKSKDSQKIAEAEHRLNRIKFISTNSTEQIFAERLAKLNRTKDQWFAIKGPNGEPVGKQQWFDLWKATWLDYYGLHGTSAEKKDPQELYYEMTKKKEDALQAIMKTQQMKRELPKFKDELIMQTHPTWGAAKSEAEKVYHYQKREQILTEMGNNTFSSEENQRQAEAYRMMVIEALGPEIMKRLGMQLGYDEAAYIANELDRAQRMGRTIDQNRLVLYITNLRRNKAAATKPRK